MTNGPELDVAVAGDGPAASALASACRAAGMSVAIVGEDRPWTATYGTWRDDVPELTESAFVAVVPTVTVWADTRRDLDRPYGVIDNAGLRSELRRGVDHQRAWATGVQHFAWGSRLLTGSGEIDARLVVDAVGWPPLVGSSVAAHEPAWQTAFGIVVPVVPGGVGEGATLMDLRPPPGPATDIDPPTFAYVIPVRGGWLVEETVLAARPAVDPDALRDRLRDRIGPWPLDTPTERVRIAMGAAAPRAVPTVVPFGAAAGYVHPATGYSLAPSLRSARRVATAAASSIDAGCAGAELMADVWAAVWPAPMRRTRRLHRIGLAALLSLDSAATRSFFEVFFGLPVERWREYLRVDATPGEVARTMRAVFAASPPSLRRRLAAAVPRAGLDAMARR